MGPPYRADYYSVLNVRPSASTAEILAAYKQAALATHPDKGGSCDRFNQVREAFSVLTTEREEFDAHLASSPNEAFAEVIRGRDTRDSLAARSRSWLRRLV